MAGCCELRLVAISRLMALGNSNRSSAHCDARCGPSTASRAAIGDPSARTCFTGIERPVLGRTLDPHVGVPGDRIINDAGLAIAHAHSNGRCGGTIRRMLDELAAADVLDTAYDWLCKRRRDYPPGADIWFFRHRCREEKAMIKPGFGVDHRRWTP